MHQAEFLFSDGTQGAKVSVEVDEPRGGDGITRAPRGPEGVFQATATFEKAIGNLRPLVLSIRDTLRDLKPDSVEVQFGFKLSAEGSLVVVKGSGEANFNMKLSWGGSQK